MMAARRAASQAYLSEIFVSVQGEGSYAGQRHLFVRFAGCNIRCRYCDTPESLERTTACLVDWPDGRRERLANPLSADCLAGIVETMCTRDPRISMVALTGGEPLLQHRFLCRYLREHPPPQPCLLETNALIREDLEAIVERVAVVSADVKLPSANGGASHWRHHEQFLRRCTRAELYAKIVVGDETPASEVEAATQLVRRHVPGAKIYLQPMTDPRSGAWQISQTRLVRLAAAQSVSVRPQLHKLIGVR